MRGRLIVFEGPEGAGKTTQLRRLEAWYAARGDACVAVREPGSSAIGDEIRRLLLRPDAAIVPAAEALLFMASRAQLVREVIEPRLAEGATVLVDRFFLSTYAYQVAGRGLPEAEVRAANRLATGSLVPDLTLLLTVAARTRDARRARRGTHDRLEREDVAFHERVARAFDEFLAPGWQRAHDECGPLVRVDAEGTPDDVFQRVLAALGPVRPAAAPAVQGVRS